MSRDNRQALIIQRAICYLIAAVGILLLWASTSHAALPVMPNINGFNPSPINEMSVPDPATLFMLTAGIGCVFVKMRKATV